jgi:hypothetical protein
MTISAGSTGSDPRAWSARAPEGKRDGVGSSRRLPPQQAGDRDPLVLLPAGPAHQRPQQGDSTLVRHGVSADASLRLGRTRTRRSRVRECRCRRPGTALGPDAYPSTRLSSASPERITSATAAATAEGATTCGSRVPSGARRSASGSGLGVFLPKSVSTMPGLTMLDTRGAGPRTTVARRDRGWPVGVLP